MFTPLYIFTVIHTLLAGLFSFFLPVYLLNLGYNLFEISIFLSITWYSFFCILPIWENLRKQKGINYLIFISFLIEIILVSLGFFSDKSWFLYILAIIFWIYNCFLWITQRMLFLKEINTNNIWKNFWNIQIIWFLFVKIWIFIGSYLLEYYSFFYLWITIIIINIIWIYFFFFNNNKFSLNLWVWENIKNKFSYRIKWKELIHFNDKYNSKIIFFLDWPFLFFESFFWVISLFYITNESYTQLWYLTIFLALSFSLSFYFIKNKIDKISTKKIYKIWVLLYSISWILRWYITEIDNTTLVYILILIIAFFTSFFRLTFNKEFFHITKISLWESYILFKSYYSQFSIFITFWILSILYYFLWDEYLSINIIYQILAIISLIYLKYKVDNKK